jgi:hypothetical protein
MHRIYLFLLVFGLSQARAQELFVFSEPASNMPAKSIGLKVNSRYASLSADRMGVRLVPEVMFGLNKNWMTHVAIPFSSFYTANMRWEALRVYSKYRFLSQDGHHRHFRMAAFLEGAYSRNPYLYDEINLDGDHTGWQTGVIATQLLHRLAISSTVSMVKSYMTNNDGHAGHMEHSMLGLNYSFSAGYLLFPKQYTSYQQTNLNLYVELLGMQGLEMADYMVDLAPAVQLIFNSTTKLNLGARFQLNSNMDRIARNSVFVSLEHSLLGAW